MTNIEAIMQRANRLIKIITYREMVQYATFLHLNLLPHFGLL